MTEPFGMILYPGMRALAYLNACRNAGVFPTRVLALSGTLSHREEILGESRRYGYDQRYFDTALNPETYCQRHGIPYTLLEAVGINDHALEEHLRESPLATWIFTGGGILRQRLLSLGKRFLHVHPGRLPDYRGSTTFYYSLLEEGGLQATAFYMGSEIDEGPVLAEATFRVNVQIRPDQPHFMDAILDPFIRATLLEWLLKRYQGALPAGRPPAHGEGSPYFIIHPFLRTVAISRLNHIYSTDMPEGIFLTGAPSE